MIEVNLLPGGKKRSGKGRGFSLSGLRLPSFGGGGGPAADPYILSAIAAGIVSLGIMAWLFMGIRSQREELQVELRSATQDSVRFADLIKRTDALTARRDSIAQRVGIIQKIDADRYVWPHIFDEIGRALPDYTWLTEIAQTGSDPLTIRIAGDAGNLYAVTSFMTNLEASPFLRNVHLERTEGAQSKVDRRDVVQEFSLTLNYQSPPLDQLHTVPLFDNQSAGPAESTADTTGTPGSPGGAAAPGADTTKGGG